MHFKLKRQAGWHCPDTFLHGNEQLLFCIQWGNYKKGRMIQNLQNTSSSSLNNPRNDASFSGSLRISRRWYHRLLLANIREPKPVIYIAVIHAEIRQRVIHSECCCGVFCFFLFGRGHRTSRRVLRCGPGHVRIRLSPVWAIGSKMRPHCVLRAD